VSRCNNPGVFIVNGSKLNLHSAVIENCRFGLFLDHNSEVHASECKFNKI
jgi:hypothetical protein